jgi:hypothetical protein
MTSSQCDPRGGQDDAIGGDARETRPFTRAWFFEELSSKELRAIEPDGTEHYVKLGDLNSLAGTKLRNAMARDLTRKEKP